MNCRFQAEILARLHSLAWMAEVTQSSGKRLMLDGLVQAFGAVHPGAEMLAGFVYEQLGRRISHPLDRG